jgi:hypothetical protein
MNQPTLPARRLLLMILGLAATALSYAQTSGDPTKPAPVWLALQPKAPGAAAVEVDAGTPGAQIVVVGPTRKFAMVDGQAVRPGETYKGSKLLNIGPDGLVWQTEGRRELTSMSPGVQKTDPAARQSKQPGAKPGQKH